MNNLKTIKSGQSQSIKIERSEFIGFLFPINDLQQVKEILATHHNQYKDATHNCYAYILGSKQETQYYSDQGEPSGTAGKPMLNMLLKHNLTNVLAIVTRYYGGIKLGVRGLIDAYSETVELTIKSTKVIDFVAYIIIQITCDYAVLDNLKHQMKKFDVITNTMEFTENVKAELNVPEENITEVNKILDDFKQKGQLLVLS